MQPNGTTLSRRNQFVNTELTSKERQAKTWYIIVALTSNLRFNLYHLIVYI